MEELNWKKIYVGSWEEVEKFFDSVAESLDKTSANIKELKESLRELEKTSIQKAIIKLWDEGMNSVSIAWKLGIFDELGHPDTEFVEMVIDNPDNYPKRSYLP